MKTLIIATILLSSNLLGGIAPITEITAPDISFAADRSCEAMALAEGMEDPVEGTFELKDLAGNIFYAKIGEEKGFMVYDPVAQNFIEKSTALHSPYDFSEAGDYYYFGPMNYYERIEDTFYSMTVQDEQFPIEYAYQLQDIFSQQLLTFRNAQSEQAYEKYRANNGNDVAPILITKEDKIYIENYQYIRDAKYPSNYDASCGFVAASLILNYWDKTMHRGTVLPQYLDANGELNDTGKIYSPTTNLKDKLVDLNGGKEYARSWGESVRDAMIRYCREANLSAVSSYYLGSIGLNNELASGRPAIIFGALPHLPDSYLFTHAVTAYGLEKEWWGGYYIVNYGMDTDNVEVSLGIGFVGSVTFFQLDANTYAKDYLVQPDDYGFQDAYVNPEVTKTVNADGLTFETNRLRCGYTQQEYINLCPRKAGEGTAYLEYCFDDPVYKIDVNLSFWSDDERYFEDNIAQARIEYQRLCEDAYLPALDLLTADLPTDRTQQKTYTITFPGGTRCFRFYTHFDYMSGYTDRNKGRISIGDMRIYIYQ